MRFKVVAERSHGLFNGEHRITNPFLIRDIFNPNLRARIERRTWDSVEARSEKEVRRLFAEALKTLPGMQGFVIATIERLDTPAASSTTPTTL